MQHDHGLSLAALDVVKTDIADFEEFPNRRVVAFGVLGDCAIDECGDGKRRHYGGDTYRNGMRRDVNM
jgi:hypothetical protein